MNEWPKISVVTPSYNQGKFIEQTIQSILNQNYPNLEYIIIDGASTDNSVDIIKKYADHLAYWVSEKDKNMTEAINKGFRRATGEIMCWLNTDDEYCPGALEVVARTFMANPDVDFVFGDSYNTEEDGKIFRRARHTKFNFAALVILGMIVSQPACFWRRSVFDKYGYLDESLPLSMDYEFFLRIGQHIKTKYIRKCLARFRYQSESKTCTLLATRQKEDEMVKSPYLKAAYKGYPSWMVLIWIHIQRAFWYMVQGDGLYVLQGICRRALPKSMRPPWL